MDSLCPKLSPRFSLELFFGFLGYIFLDKRIHLDFSRFILSLKIYSERLKYLLFFGQTGLNQFCLHPVPYSLTFHLNQIMLETEPYVGFGFSRWFVITVSSGDQQYLSKTLILIRSTQTLQNPRSIHIGGCSFSGPNKCSSSSVLFHLWEMLIIILLS